MNTDGALPRQISFLTSDLFAGIVVFLVALPLCLGIALASGAPLASGLLAGIVGGILVGMVSGSHTSVSGPAAGLTAVVAAQITMLGSFEAFLTALFVAGLIQIAMGASRVGFIAAFFPSSVIKGLLAAIGIILVLKQLPHLVGWDMDADGEMAFWQPDEENTFSEIGKMLFHFHAGAMVIGVLSLALLLSWDNFSWLKKSRVPASLVVVIIGIVASTLLQSFGQDWFISSEHRVQVPIASDFASMLGFLRWPDLSALSSPSVYLAGFTLALVGSLETLLNLEAIDKIDPKKRISPPNRELIAQGIGNTFLGLIGGIPVTSVIIRSSVNINAGAKTKTSAIAHGALLLSCVLLLPQWLNSIPLSCLAAILIVTGLKLASPKLLKQMWRGGINQFLPFAITVVAIVFTDLLIGVVIGLTTSLVFILRSNLRRPLQVNYEGHLTGEVRRVVLANQVSFLNRAALSRVFDEVPSGGHIMLDASHTDYIDGDILDLITDLRNETAPARNVKVSLFGFKDTYHLENVTHYAEHSTLEVQRNLNPNQVLQILKGGNERVRTGKRLQRDLGRQITATSSGQFPLGVVLSCMDSRAPVELIFDLGIGDIFSVRMAGNVVSERVLGSLEFACAIAGAKLIVVMSHTRCGAIGAAIDFLHSGISVNEATGCQHLGGVVSDIQKVVDCKITSEIPPKGTEERELFEERVTRAHVLECIDSILRQSTTIKQLVDQGRIAIAGCVYDVRTGSVTFVQEPSNAIQPEPATKPEMSLVVEQTSPAT